MADWLKPRYFTYHALKTEDFETWKQEFPSTARIWIRQRPRFMSALDAKITPRRLSGGRITTSAWSAIPVAETGPLILGARLMHKKRLRTAYPNTSPKRGKKGRVLGKPMPHPRKKLRGKK
jgi:hypothetical protein